MKWVPAHVADSVPGSLLTEDFATQHGTTVLSILRNKQGDRIAKRAANDAAPIHPKWDGPLQQRIFQAHEQLGDVVAEPDPSPACDFDACPFSRDCSTLASPLALANPNQCF